MSDDSEKIAGMAIYGMARDIDEKDAEIERLRQETLVQSEAIKTLRGLLREELDGDIAGAKTWELRVREALGE